MAHEDLVMPIPDQPLEAESSTTVQGPGQDMIQRLYRELRRLAACQLRRLPAGGQTLQPTALVHEAYLCLCKDPDKIWHGRRHFYHAAALAMRRILLQRARARRTLKRGGDWKRADITITLADQGETVLLSPEDVLTLDRALYRLRDEFPELVELVLLRYFCGLTIREIAELLGHSARTVERKWSFARAWLLTEIRGVPASSQP